MGKRKQSTIACNPSSETPPIPSSVKKVLDNYESAERQVLLELRDLVFATAQSDDRVGKLTETLKWGEPAYLTDETKSGSTLRLGHSKLSDSPAIFVSCSTPLLETFKEMDKSNVLSYHGLRDIAVPKITSKNKKMLETCMLRTLTYHAEKQNSKKARKGKKT